jgi:hypothetical protein
MMIIAHGKGDEINLVFVFMCYTPLFAVESRGSSVGMATGYGLNDRGSGVRFTAGTGNFSLLHRIQTDSGAYPPSHPMCTGGKAAGVRS